MFHTLYSPLVIRGWLTNVLSIYILLKIASSTVTTIELPVNILNLERENPSSLSKSSSENPIKRHASRSVKRRTRHGSSSDFILTSCSLVVMVQQIPFGDIILANESNVLSNCAICMISQRSCTEISVYSAVSTSSSFTYSDESAFSSRISFILNSVGVPGGNIKYSSFRRDTMNTLSRDCGTSKFLAFITV